MDNQPNKILAVAFLETSRDILFEIKTQMKAVGFAVDVCFAKQDEETPEPQETQIIPDLYLTKATDLAIYKGVIFLDDGLDLVSSVSLAVRADKVGLPIGGYGEGCRVLSKAKLLNDKFVAKGLPDDISKGAKLVNSPAVKCENIITCAGACPIGFVTLFADTLGGEVKKIVESDTVKVAGNSALIVSMMERWPEYWELAERLSSKGVTLLLADWTSMNLDTKRIAKCLVMDPKQATKVSCIANIDIPQRIWFKQTSIGCQETIAAVQALEKIGCVNVNSSEAIKLANDKVRTAEVLGPICYQGDPTVFDDSSIDDATNLLVSSGTRWTKPIDQSLGTGVIRIQGRGKTAIVSRRVKGSAVHKIVTRQQLAGLLRSAYNRDRFMVQNDLGSMHFADKNFELRFVMRRTPEGWKTSAQIARAGILISNPNENSPGLKAVACSAEQASKLVFADKWTERLASARQRAMEACIAFQSGLSDPNGVNELGVDITFAGDQPNVIEVNSVPDLTFIDRAASGKYGFRALASSVGYDNPPEAEVQPQELEDSRADVAPTLMPRPANQGRYIRALKKELSAYGIHIQEGNIVSMWDHDHFEKMTSLELMRILKTDLKFYYRRYEEEERKREPNLVKLMARLSLRTLHIMNVVAELFQLTANSVQLLKTADYSYSVTNPNTPDESTGAEGPYTNIPPIIQSVNAKKVDWYKELGLDIDDEKFNRLLRYDPNLFGQYVNTLRYDQISPRDGESGVTKWEDMENGEGFPAGRKVLKK